MDKVTILLVDDTPANLAVIYDYLKLQGYHVLVTDNGIDAVEQVNVARPDLVLLDVRMPGMDGYETCRAIKANNENANMPIMFLSALTDLDDRLRGFEAGAVDFVAKPLNALEVEARIKTHVTIGRLQQQLAEQNEQLEARIRQRTAELHSANAALQKEIQQTNQQKNEKERLLSIMEEQNQQLRTFTDWLLQSRPEIQTELTQLISQPLLRNWLTIGADLDEALDRLEQLGQTNEAVYTLLEGIRYRTSKVEQHLHQMLSLGHRPDTMLNEVAPPEPSILSEREREILKLFCNGLSTSEIATQLSISSVTVRTHRTRIMQKLDIHHLPGLVKYAIKHDLTELNQR